jgi:hypothetical protein
MEWLASKGARILVPVGHCPDYDIGADFDGRLVRVQVKTSTQVVEPSNEERRGRWQVALATRGGNQSWNRIVKRFSPERADFLFVHVADGRRWFIPADRIDGATAIVLGGPKYAEFEVDPGRPFEGRSGLAPLHSDSARRGSRAVKGAAL